MSESQTRRRAALGTTGAFAEAVTPTLPAAVASVPTRSDRVGKTPLPFWVAVPTRQQLRILAAELDKSMQSCMIEALNDFFRKHGKPPIA